MIYHSKTVRFFHSFAFFFIVLTTLPLIGQNAFVNDKSLQPVGLESKDWAIQIPNKDVTQPDWQKIKQEDEGFLGTFRYAVPTPVNINTRNTGIWRIKSDGKKVWQAVLTSQNAVGLAFTLDSVQLKAGEAIFVYDPEMKTVLGAFTNKDLTPSHKLFVGFTKGKEAIIEFSSPDIKSDADPFEITTVWHAYGARALVELGFGDSRFCEININCPQGADWQVQKHGVVRIRIVAKEGVGTCTGSLVNNTKRDATPYILSAYHCSDGLTPDYSQWGFFFNYEATSCVNQAVQPISGLITGCTLRSGGRDNDFLLLELSSKIGAIAQPYYCGWSRDTVTLPTSTTLIHHPMGDVKKITKGNSAAQVIFASTNWGNNVITPSESHIQSPMNEGILEPGSSGAPMFDQNKRIFSQLHGANLDPTDTCKPTAAIGGRFARAWNNGSTPDKRLKDWLDPIGKNPTVFDGEDNTSLTNPKVSGHITSAGGTPMANVKVYLNNSDSATTDASGVFTFNSVQGNTEVAFRFKKEDAADNGVDAADLLTMRRHIVGINPIADKVSLFSADVDNSLDVDAADLLTLRRLIVGITTEFTIPSWRFIPTSFPTNANFPFTLTVPASYNFTFSSSTSTFDFIGVKTGDLDFSAEVNR